VLLVHHHYPGELADRVFLDVYVENEPAWRLYERCQFVTLNPTAHKLDQDEGNKPYFVMARSLALTPPPSPQPMTPQS
jgi:ribosomal protein S18 acetylase RimI-like enzyme